MNPRKKILILLPDGVGLRNFAFSSFVEIGEKLGWEVIFWNHTLFDLKGLGYSEIKLQGKPRAKTDLLKRAKIEAELDYFTGKFDDPVYQTYKFAGSDKDLKKKLKNYLVSVLVKIYREEKGLRELSKKLIASERRGEFYHRCKQVLEKEKPDLVFCTNQRPITAIAPLTAARDLGIPTSTFIFSWDNLPKATMVVKADHYFVWSEHMKQELHDYYPHISSHQIQVTGSPQFESHFEEDHIVSKNKFFKRYKLDNGKRYLCFSGDDITTSPHDEVYLRDVAEAVKELNAEGNNLGIIFRRSPADLSERYDPVIEYYRDIIVPLDPLWERMGQQWNQLLPTKADLKLQSQVIQHSFMVINVGSSMVFDYIIYEKPCGYINYNPERVAAQKDIREIYNYVHFRSMPSEEPVLWINDRKTIKKVIQQVLKGDIESTLVEAKNWFKKINSSPAEMASERIWKSIEKIAQNTPSK